MRADISGSPSKPLKCQKVRYWVHPCLILLQAPVYSTPEQARGTPSASPTGHICRVPREAATKSSTNNKICQKTWSISPLLDKVFPWKKYNPVTREEVNEFILGVFGHQGTHAIIGAACGTGNMDGNGGNIPCAWHRTCCSAPHPVFQRLHDCGRHLHGGHGRAPEGGHPPLHQRGETHIAMMKLWASMPASMPTPRTAMLCLPDRFPLRHQSGSGYLPGTHPAGPYGTPGFRGNGPGRGGPEDTKYSATLRRTKQFIQ